MTCGTTHHLACACREAEFEKLREENGQLVCALKEFTLPPYHDSNLSSWAEWVNARAIHILAGIQSPPQSEPQKEKADPCNNCQTPLTWYPAINVYSCEGCGEAGMGTPPNSRPQSPPSEEKEEISIPARRHPTRCYCEPDAGYICLPCRGWLRDVAERQKRGE